MYNRVTLLLSLLVLLLLSLVLLLVIIVITGIIVTIIYIYRHVLALCNPTDKSILQHRLQ